MKTRLLIIDDDPAILEMMQLLFEGEGMEVMLESTGEAAERIVASRSPRLAPRPT